MNNKILRPLSLVLCSLVVSLAALSSAFGAATIVIQNADGPGEGFNDPTVVAPVGGNSGTTLGQQRLIAFQEAANIWGATLTSSVTITIQAQFNPLTCSASSAVLGSAGANFVFRDFPSAPFAGTWYGESLANKITGVSQNAAPDIISQFNSNLGQPGCLTGTFFYLGLDNNHGPNIDLVAVLLHEFGHGLGFATFTNSSTGAQFSGFPTIYDRFLMDGRTGKSWLQMSNAERATSAVNTHKLAWNGPQIQTDVPSVIPLGVPVLQINSPPLIADSYFAGTAAFGPPLSAAGVTGDLLLANDGTAPVTDGCEAFPAGFFLGKIAVIDRGGPCGFAVKTKNAQDVGAVAVVIVNNVGGSTPPGMGGVDPTITIPTASVTLADGNTIKAQMGLSTLNGTAKFDTTRRSGTDQFGKALLYTPNPFEGGSSVSHWDTITFPNLLMEPFISGDLTHNVTTPSDLTFSQLIDIGWVASSLPSSIAKTTGDNQNAAQNQPFLIPISVTVSPAVSDITVTWTANPNGAGAGASFPSTGSRFATSTTNALGVALAPPLTANSTPGVHSLNATAPGAGTTTFTLSNDTVPVLGDACITDTTQADFQAGVATNTDVTTSPGDVILANPVNVDQQNTTLSTSGNGISTTAWSGQTFTPSVTGQLAKVDINLFCAGCTGTAPTVTVSVRATSAGLPTGADLAAVTFTTNTSGAGGYFTATFPSPPALTAGTIYALAIRNATNPSAGTNAVTRSATDVYAGGARVTSGNSGGTWTPQVTDIGFITYMQTSFSAAGSFVSGLKDSNPPVPGSTLWSTLSWNATVPAPTTLQFQVAASNSFAGPFNFVGPGGTAATFFTNGASLAQFNGLRYLKYKAFFTTTDSAITPSLHDVTICYNNPTPPNVSGTKTKSGGNTTGSSGSYTVILTNNGGVAQADNSGDEFTDTLPSSLALVSAIATSGTATTVGNTVNWNGSILPGGSVTITINFTINSVPGGTVVSNQGTINYDGDGNASNEASRLTDDPSVGGANDPTVFTAFSPSDISGTKTKAGGETPGETITYTVVLSNSSSSAQFDNPTDEFTDTLPASLTLVSANATSGTATTGGNTVTWNGSIPAAGSVTITITATINNVPDGTIVSNQGTINYDADGNSTNEASRMTDDPGVAGANNPTTFAVVSKPDLTIAKSHTGNFNPGQTVAYTIIVNNVGTGVTTSLVTVTDNVPVGLTPTGPNGAHNGWNCSIVGQTLTCSRSDALVGGASYPSITLTVNVANPAPSNVTNTATVAGGGEVNTSNNTATDPTAINCSPDFSLNNANPLVISRFRMNGPGGPQDEFVEIFNPGATDHTVASGNCAGGGYGVHASAGNGTTSNSVALVCYIPNGTVIPAGGYYLCTGATYSLTNLGLNGGGAGATSVGDAPIGCGGSCIADIPNDAGLALMNVTQGITSLPGGGFDGGVPAAGFIIYDRVGFSAYGPGAPASTYPSLAVNFCEGGACLKPVGDATTGVICTNPSGLFPVFPAPPACYGLAGQYQLLRRQTTFDANLGTVHIDTNSSANDWILVAPNSSSNMGLALTGVSGVTAIHGAAGPQGSTAPRDTPSTSLKQDPFDPAKAQLTPPNAERSFALDPAVADPANNPLGTFSLRLRFTNNSASNLSGLRFRVENVSTLCGPHSASPTVGSGDAKNLSSTPDCGTGSLTAILKLLNSAQEVVVDGTSTPQTINGTVMEDLSASATPTPPGAGPLSPRGGGIDSSLVINPSNAPASTGDGVTGGSGVFATAISTTDPTKVIRIKIKFGVVRGGRFVLLITPMAKPAP